MKILKVSEKEDKLKNALIKFDVKNFPTIIRQKFLFFCKTKIQKLLFFLEKNILTLFWKKKLLCSESIFWNAGKKVFLIKIDVDRKPELTLPEPERG